MHNLELATEPTKLMSIALVGLTLKHQLKIEKVNIQNTLKPPQPRKSNKNLSGSPVMCIKLNGGISPVKQSHSKKISDQSLFTSKGFQNSPDKDASTLMSLGIVGMYEYFKLTTIMSSSCTSKIETLMKKIKKYRKIFPRDSLKNLEKNNAQYF